MKKLMILSAGLMLAVASNAASVGWTLAGAANYAGDAYSFFVIGQNGASSIATVTALLDQGKAYDSYAFGSGVVAANGSANVTAASSGKSIDGTGDYTGFFIVFDSATPTSGTSKYVVISGMNTLTKTIGTSTASIQFSTGNASSIINDTNNWSSYGTPAAEPEPTSALMMLFGLAGLALRRKRA